MHNQQRKRQSEFKRPENEMESIILDLARVTRVQRGGKRLRFRACVGVGDKKGKVGTGIAKGSDVSIAVEKATKRAKKHLITVPINETGTIPHETLIKHKAAHILFKPARPGTGIKAGGVIRTMCDLAGIQNISAKILGTTNKINNAKAVIEAFKQFKV